MDFQYKIKNNKNNKRKVQCRREKKRLENTFIVFFFKTSDKPTIHYPIYHHNNSNPNTMVKHPLI